MCKMMAQYFGLAVCLMGCSSGLAFSFFKGSHLPHPFIPAISSNSANCNIERRGRIFSNAHAPIMRFGLTSSVIETVATSILNLALANPRQASIDCHISSSAMGLLQGNLDEAKIDGFTSPKLTPRAPSSRRNWVTPMGMTMRSIALNLEGMKIKPQDVFRGKISFNGQFRFLREGTILEPETGHIKFRGVWQNQLVVLKACQPERFGRIHVGVAELGRLTALGCETLGEEMTNFFNSVVLDLDGTMVSFSDMQTGRYLNGRGEALRVTVDIMVHRLPNPANMKF